ncbi:hypothetical protein [Aliiroseovarius crassostreae]|uniref:hypothetical protein n=1 Tax=Aliiroseovarius crassostreae TaxID=154981 RepID=UPI0022007124|nr:hypothetical protein [Aliiroseovarius crassostreae]UWQ04931.1 hypothetical protein K3X22_00140 [Aliiroseovarius crassostreae]
MKQKTFRFGDRAKQKALSRARDEARLKSGEVTPSELRKENAFIKGSGFAKKKIGFSPRYRPENGDKYFMVEPDGIKRVSGDESEDTDESS